MPQLPTIGPAPRPQAQVQPPRIGPAPAPTAFENWTDPQQLTQALQDLTEGLWRYGTHPAEMLGQAAQGGAQAAQGLWEFPTRLPEVAQGLGQVGVGGFVQGMGDYLGERFGSPTQAVQTALTDPVGALMDLPIDPVTPGLLTAGALIAKPGKQIVKAGSAAGRLGVGARRPYPNMPGFYSKTVEAAGLLPEQLDVAGVVGALRGLGATDKNMQLLKLPELLEGRTGKITNQEIVRHLEKNLPRLEIKKLGGADLSEGLKEYFKRSGQSKPRTPEGWSNLARDLEELAYSMEDAGQNADEMWDWSGEASAIADGGLPNVDKEPMYSFERYPDLSSPSGMNYTENLLKFEPPYNPEAGAGMETLYETLKQRLAAQNIQVGTRYAGNGRELLFATADNHPLTLWDVYDQVDADTSRLIRHFQAAPDRVDEFRQPHWPQERDVLAHSRADDLVLGIDAKVNNQGLLEDITERIRQAVGVKSARSLASGSPEVAVAKGAITPEEKDLWLAGWLAKQGTVKKGPRLRYPEIQAARERLQPAGRYIEEFQSDWHAKARDLYREAVKRATQDLTEGTPEYTAAVESVPRDIGYDVGGRYGQEVNATRDTYEQAAAKIQELQQKYGMTLREAIEYHNEAPLNTPGRLGLLRPDGTPRTAVEEGFLISNDLGQAEQEFTRAMDALTKLTNNPPVPDAPLKQEWFGPLFKQHLWEVANSDDLSWLGFTPADTQIARYDLGDKFDELTYDLNRQVLSGIKRGELRAIEHRVSPEELSKWVGPEVGEQLLGLAKMEGGRGTGRLVGKELSIEKPGKRQLYDVRFPREAEDILKPFGAKLERAPVETGGRSVDPYFGGDAGGPDVVSWVAKLSPEVKQAIRERGLDLFAIAPILMALEALQGGYQQ